MATESPTIHREVRVGDPSLSDETNRLLTRELQAVLDRSVVDVPASTTAEGSRSHAKRRSAALLGSTRLGLAITSVVLLTVAATITLVTGSWLALLLAIAVHALGLAAVLAMMFKLTGEVEHVSPSLAARLEEEGVTDPDELFTELVEDYTAEPDGAGAGRDTVRQSRALTPSATL